MAATKETKPLITRIDADKQECILSAHISAIRGPEHLSITRTRHTLRLSLFSVLSVAPWFNRLWRVQITPRRHGEHGEADKIRSRADSTSACLTSAESRPTPPPRASRFGWAPRANLSARVLSLSESTGKMGTDGHRLSPFSEGGTQWSEHLRVAQRSRSIGS